MDAGQREENLNSKSAHESGDRPLTEECLVTLVHELRSPLLVFEFGLSALEEQLQNSCYAETLRMMRRQLRISERLLQEAAQLTDSSPGQVVVRKDVCDFSETVADVVRDLRPVFARAQVEVVTDIQEAIQVHVDPLHLNQILHNLLNNAIRYTQAGGQVAVRCLVGEGRAMVLIEDNGIGISEEEQGLIFRPFYRGASRDHAEGGLGLGLSVVARLLQANGGSITVSSFGTDRGSTFAVSFPLV